MQKLDESSKNDLNQLKNASPNFTFANRLSSFKHFIYDKRINSPCSSPKLARAGWFSVATKTSPTSAKCPFCGLQHEFQEKEDPWKVHQALGARCEFVQLGKLDERDYTIRDAVNLATRCATTAFYEEMMKVVDILENGLNYRYRSTTRAVANKKILSFRNTSKLLSMEQRLATFQDFPYDKSKGAKCTSKKLAQAGWYSIAGNRPSAKCPFCLIALEFEASDDPWTEHKKFSPSCDFVKLGKLNEDTWSMEEAMMLGARVTIMKKYARERKLVDELEINKESHQMTEEIRKMIEKPRRRGSI